MAAPAVVLLAGGASSRMGSDKASLLVAGRPLIDHVLDDLTRTAGIGAVVVVGPDWLKLPPWVLRTLEDPPGGGPVAGLFAGIAALGAASTDRVIVLTCDAPRAARAIELLLAAWGPAADGVVARSEDRVQYLLAGYRVAALHRALAALRPGGDAHGLAMRQLVAQLTVSEVPVAAPLAADLDSPGDVERWQSFGQ